MPEKRRPGRPSLSQGKTPVTSLKLPAPLRAKLEEIAREAGVSIGEILRRAAEYHVLVWETFRSAEVKVVVVPTPRHPPTAEELQDLSRLVQPDPLLTTAIRGLMRKKP